MICKNCSSEFPSSIKIDGKLRILTARKYCLVCSPFGEHRTRPIGYRVMEGKECICDRCHEAYTYHRGKGITTKLCSGCYGTVRHIELKERAISYLGGKCKICGYCKCRQGMVFHHTDPEIKEFDIAGTNRSWARLVKELDKCVLLCNNCHVEVHAGVAELPAGVTERYCACLPNKSSSVQLRPPAQVASSIKQYAGVSLKCWDSVQPAAMDCSHRFQW